MTLKKIVYFSRLMCSPNFCLRTIKKASAYRTFTSAVRLIYYFIDGSIYCFIAALKLFLISSILGYFLWTQIKCRDSLEKRWSVSCGWRKWKEDDGSKAKFKIEIKHVYYGNCLTVAEWLFRGRLSLICRK